MPGLKVSSRKVQSSPYMQSPLSKYPATPYHPYLTMRGEEGVSPSLGRGLVGPGLSKNLSEYCRLTSPREHFHTKVLLCGVLFVFWLLLEHCKDFVMLSLMASSRSEYYHLCGMNCRCLNCASLVFSNRQYWDSASCFIFLLVIWNKSLLIFLTLFFAIAFEPISQSTDCQWAMFSKFHPDYSLRFMF